ncbi:hypothetical protein Tco_0000052 [Tanacetum coccineum]
MPNSQGVRIPFIVLSHVMSTPAHFDSEIFLRTDGARSSRVPIPLSDEPIRAVRQSHLVDTDIESGPLEDLRETEIPQPLPNTESDPVEAPSETEEFEAYEPSDTRITSSHSTAPSDSTTQLSPDHPLTQTSPALTRASYYHSTARMVVHTQPTLSPGISVRIAKADALSPSLFRKRYRSSYETPSPSSFPTLPIRKRFRGTSKLVEDTKDESSDLDTKREGLEDEGPGLEDEGHGLEDEVHGSKDEGPGSEEEAVPEGQQQAVLVVDIATDEPLGLGYRALIRRELALAEGSVPSTFEIGQSSRSMSKHQRVEETLTPMPRVRTTWVDPVDGTVYTDFLVDVPPARVPKLFEGYDRDLRELYTRLRDVRDEIFSQRYRLRSLKQEQERATVTFSAIWRQVLASEGWTGNVETLQRQRCTSLSMHIHDMAHHSPWIGISYLLTIEHTSNHFLPWGRSDIQVAIIVTILEKRVNLITLTRTTEELDTVEYLRTFYWQRTRDHGSYPNTLIRETEIKVYKELRFVEQ